MIPRLTDHGGRKGNGEGGCKQSNQGRGRFGANEGGKKVVFFFLTQETSPLHKFQAKEEIVGFCQINPCVCLLPSWGGCVVCDVRSGRGKDLHVHGGASQLVGEIFTFSYQGAF